MVPAVPGMGQPYTPLTRTTLPLAVRNRSAFSARYSSESYQRRASSMLENSVTTMQRVGEPLKFEHVGEVVLKGYRFAAATVVRASWSGGG